MTSAAAGAASVGGDERLRLFCALRLPEDAVDELVRWQAAHLRGGRIVPRDHLHLTLAFLGHRPAAELPAVAGALRDVARAAGPIELEVERYRETRSVGMVVLRDRTGEAGRLAVSLHERLAALGVYEPESRTWLAHVTVLRFRERPRLRPPLPELGRVVPSDAAVFLSRLRPGGAQYEVLESFVLGG